MSCSIFKSGISGCLSWIPWRKVSYKVSSSGAGVISRTKGKHPLSSFNKLNKTQNCLKWLESVDLRAMVLGYNSIVCLMVRHLDSGICLPGIFFVFRLYHLLTIWWDSELESHPELFLGSLFFWSQNCLGKIDAVLLFIFIADFYF